MLLKKISAKTLIGDVKKAIENLPDGDRLKLFTVMGRANGVETGSTSFGDWVAFKGKFEAINIATGEVSVAPKCFLPEPLQSMTVEALRQHETIEFALEVGVLVNKKLPMGYEYTVDPILAIKESDDLAHLRDLTKARLALSAPKDELSPEETKPKKK